MSCGSLMVGMRLVLLLELELESLVFEIPFGREMAGGVV